MCSFAVALDERVTDSFASNDMITVVFGMNPSGNIYTVPEPPMLQYVVLNIPLSVYTDRKEVSRLER